MITLYLSLRQKGYDHIKLNLIRLYMRELAWRVCIRGLLLQAIFTGPIKNPAKYKLNQVNCLLLLFAW